MSTHKCFTRVLLVLSVILSVFFTACSQAQISITDTTEEVTSIPIPYESDIKAEIETDEFQITPETIIIRPNKSSEEEIEAANLILRGLKAVTGLQLSVTTDRVTKDDENTTHDFEILIGLTNRPYSQDTYSSLLHDDYCYEIIDNNVIVLCGGSPKATLNAARAFMKDLFGFDESNGLEIFEPQGKQVVLDPGISYLYKGEYPIKTLKLEGVPISEYCIVSAFSKDRADIIVESVADLCGVNIPVITKSEYKPGTPAIFLGCSDEEGNHLDLIFDNYVYYITASGEDVPRLIIDSANQFSIKEAAEQFTHIYFNDVKIEDVVNIPLSTSLVSGYALGKEGNKLLFSEILEERIIAEGITYTDRLYYDQNNAPIRAYVLTVSKGSGRLYTGTPEDGTVLLDKNGTVPEEMIAARENGRPVIAGVNADFFAINGDYLPRGLCIKEGEELHSVKDRPWFGVLYDGTYTIGNPAEYKKVVGQLQTAVGGQYIILKDGKIFDIGLGTKFGYTRHPRTAVGFNKNGDLVLLVVDGRQETLSNGASLGDLAGIMKELGCTDALNLDGGGSSTIVIDDGSGQYLTMNSPSDGKLRKIQNSLLVLLPDD